MLRIFFPTLTFLLDQTNIDQEQQNLLVQEQQSIFNIILTGIIEKR